MATLTVYSGSGDGYVRRTGDNTPSGATEAASGTSVDHTSTTIPVAFARIPNDYDVYRGYLVFDTSSLGAAATIISAVLSLYVVSKTNESSGGLGVTGPTTQASPNSLALSDYSLNSTQQIATPVGLDSLTTGAYNNFTLNSTGLSIISKTGNTFIGLRSWNTDHNGFENDIPNGKTNSVVISSSEATGTSQDPKLVITYDPGTTTSTTTSTSTTSTSTSTSTTTTSTSTSTSTTTTLTSTSTSTTTTSTSSSTTTTSTSTSTTTTITSTTTTVPWSIAVDGV